MPESVSHKDAERLRELGRKIAELAHLPEQAKHRAIWTAVNDGAMIRPAVLARDYPIYLINVNDELTPLCDDPFLRTVESDLLLRLYEWKHLRCHRVVEPYVNCQADISSSGLGVQASGPGSDEILAVEFEAVSSARHFDRIMSSEDDLAMIKTPEVRYDQANTLRRLDALNSIFSGIIGVKLHGVDYFQYVPWDDLLSWMGIEEGMYDFVLNPEFMLKAVARYTEAFISGVKRHESLGLITSNNGNFTIGAGGYGYTSLLPPPTASGMGARLKDVWGFAADQIMTSVSPEMSDEFAFTPEKQYGDLFGLLYYGCCERLDHKLDQLRTFGNLRKVSLSPFAKLEPAMEMLGGGDRVVSFKANSNYLTGTPPQYDLLRRELEEVCRLARKYKCNVEILMKTIITLRGEPERLWKWCDMASEIVADY